MLDFNEIKTRVKIVDVLQRRGVQLRFSGEWASARCPLPSHKSGDNDRTFQVKLGDSPHWKCWSASCNEKAGKKGGDVINLVACLDNCSQLDAAKKLADEYHIPQNESRPAKHIAQRAEKEVAHSQHPKRTESNLTSPSEKRNGYMADVDGWLDVLLERNPGEDGDAYRKRVHNGIKARLIDSFRQGKRIAQGLPVESS